MLWSHIFQFTWCWLDAVSAWLQGGLVFGTINTLSFFQGSEAISTSGPSSGTSLSSDST